VEMTPRQDDTPQAIVSHLVRAVRVPDWLHFLALPLIMVNPFNPDVWSLGRGVLLSFLTLAFAYGWNTVKDDFWGESLPDGSGRSSVSPFTTRVVSVALFLMAAATVVGSALTNVLVFGATVVAVISSALYSGGPRLKARPVIGTLLNGGIFVPLCFLGASDTAVASPHVLLAVLFGALLLQNQIIHEAAHHAQDAEDGVMTTVARFGLRWGLVAGHGFGLLSIATIVCMFVLWPSAWMVLVAAAPLVLVHFALTPARFGNQGRVTVLRRVHRYLGLGCGVLVWIAIFFQYTGA
jgi:4-hydroxybenzoate polyprenyltransferase